MHSKSKRIGKIIIQGLALAGIGFGIYGFAAALIPTEAHQPFRDKLLPLLISIAVSFIFWRLFMYRVWAAWIFSLCVFYCCTMAVFMEPPQWTDHMPPSPQDILNDTLFRCGIWALAILGGASLIVTRDLFTDEW